MLHLRCNLFRHDRKPARRCFIYAAIFFDTTGSRPEDASFTLQSFSTRPEAGPKMLHLRCNLFRHDRKPARRCFIYAAIFFDTTGSRPEDASFTLQSFSTLPEAG